MFQGFERTSGSLPQGHPVNLTCWFETEDWPEAYSPSLGAFLVDCKGHTLFVECAPIQDGSSRGFSHTNTRHGVQFLKASNGVGKSSSLQNCVFLENETIFDIGLLRRRGDSVEKPHEPESEADADADAALEEGNDEFVRTPVDSPIAPSAEAAAKSDAAIIPEMPFGHLDEKRKTFSFSDELGKSDEPGKHSQTRCVRVNFRDLPADVQSVFFLVAALPQLDKTPRPEQVALEKNKILKVTCGVFDETRGESVCRFESYCHPSAPVLMGRFARIMGQRFLFHALGRLTEKPSDLPVAPLSPRSARRAGFALCEAATPVLQSALRLPALPKSVSDLSLGTGAVSSQVNSQEFRSIEIASGTQTCPGSPKKHLEVPKPISPQQKRRAHRRKEAWKKEQEEIARRCSQSSGRTASKQQQPNKSDVPKRSPSNPNRLNSDVSSITLRDDQRFTTRHPVVNRPDQNRNNSRNNNNNRRAGPATTQKRSCRHQCGCAMQ